MIKKSILPVLVFCVAAAVFSAAPAASAESKKEVVLSTVDLKSDYEILGLVYYRSSELSPKKIHDELKKQAEDMGADHVIGITYYNNAGYLYGSGTAVRLIKNKKGE